MRLDNEKLEKGLWMADMVCIASEKGVVTLSQICEIFSEISM